MRTSSEIDSNLYLQSTATTKTSPVVSSPANPHVLKKTFHNTKHEGLSENELKTKVRRLFFEAAEISAKFHTVFTSLWTSLQERKIPKKKLVNCLIGLEMFPPVYESANQPLFKDQKHVIQAAEDIDDILPVIKDYCSFFNTHIIEIVTKHLGSDDDKQRMLEYKQAFEEYAKHELSDCPIVFGSMNDQDCTIIVKLADSFDDCTANHISLLQTKLCDILKVSTGTLRLCQANKGCYELTFQAPRLVQDIVFPLSKDQESRLKELGVVYLICGDYKFFSQDGVKVG